MWLYIYIYINKNFLIKFLVNFIYNFIYEVASINYFSLYNISIPNIYVLNFMFDLLLITIALNWLINYSRLFLSKDKKFVAFPLVASEVLLKYIGYIYLIYYVGLYSYLWINDGKLIWYGTQSMFLLFFYLEMRVHKIPRKTMPWYFRQIVDLWPATYASFWTTPVYLYIDQQKYLGMRKKFKKYRQEYKNSYNKHEIWEKKVTLAFQRDKESCLRLFTAFCKLMSRKESMLREVNVFDYPGWQQDWTYNYRKINIFNWKVDWWDKPHIYFFRKTFMYIYVKTHYFNYRIYVYRFACKHTHLNASFFIAKVLDYLYTQIYILNYEAELLQPNMQHK
jgi:hypothetical protein